MNLLTNFIEYFKMALESIKANKMRSFLTMLGIIIGISSVITIVSLGQGGQSSITGEFEKLGAATVTITVDQSNATKDDYFKMDDVKQIKERIDDVKYATPVVQKRGNIYTKDKTKVAMISGGNSDLGSIQGVELLYGRFYNDRELEGAKPVVIIDEAAARDIFGYDDVIGKTIKLGQATSARTATIIGVSKAASVFANNSKAPAFIYTPITFLQTMYPDDFTIGTIAVTATSKDKSEDVGNAAKSLLEGRHNNRGKDLYTADSALKQMDEINKVLGIFTAFIGAVAAISLIVGGIGVMNIMLVSVTERTREIGIRKAIGANTNAIMLQFLTESVIISVIGGIIGMILGIGGAQLIGVFANITPAVSPIVIIGAILFSSAVGIFFGIYPAKKAANLNPIDALRYE